MPIACFRNFQAGGSHPAGRRHRGSPVDGAEEFLRFEAQELLEDTPQVVYSPSGVILEAVGIADYFGATIFGEGYWPLNTWHACSGSLETIPFRRCLCRSWLRGWRNFTASTREQLNGR